jgi:hypothetical protein
MNYLADLQPSAIRDHNQELLREMSRLRLEKRLRDNRLPRSGGAFAFIFESLSRTERNPLRIKREGAPPGPIR